MLKIIKFIFIIFFGISLIIIASLITGFEINNIIYDNIHIKKLYLKYDKKLNISSSQITIYDLKSDNSTKMRTNLSVDFKNNLFEIDVKEFKLINTDVSFQGLVYIDKEKIDLNNKIELLVDDAIIVFDNKMEKITAKKVFLAYQNKKIDLTFQKPYYGDVDIKNTKVSFLVDENILKLYLKTNSLLNDTLKNALSRYGVEINTIQHDGKNDIKADIFIPFGEGDIFISSDVQILNSTIEDYGQKYNVSKSVLHYEDKIIKGSIDLNSYYYKDFNVTDSIVNYSIDLNDEIKANVYSDKINISQNEQSLTLNKLQMNLENNIVQLFTNIKDDKNQILVDINNTTNLNTKKTFGKVNLTYNNEENNISFFSNNMHYDGSFEDTIQMDINATNIFIEKPQKIDIKDIEVSYKDNIITTNLQITDSKNIIDMHLFDTTNLLDKSSKGKVLLNKIHYKDLLYSEEKNIPYTFSFESDISAHLPSFGFRYYNEKDTNLHILNISKPEKLLNLFPFITHKNKNNGSLNIVTHDFNDTMISINDLSFDINSSKIQSKEDTNASESIVIPELPKINLTYTNSHIKYDTFNFLFDTLDLTSDTNELHMYIKKDKTSITTQIVNNGLIFNAKDVTDTYINNLLNRDILEGGYLNLNVYGEDINLLSGDINFHKTTVKNVTIVNNLLTFVNTTPAIINPLLALPTLFRMAETGFDTDGYYMKNGDGSFQYNLPAQQLDMYDLYTNGKMSNFIVNSHTDFKTKAVKANVDISFLKDFTKAIRHIPLLGYIVMGDDGEFHTSVDITGTLDNPSIETHTVKEATKGVTGILKRIITLPLKPFQIETTEEQMREHEKRVQELMQ